MTSKITLVKDGSGPYLRANNLYFVGIIENSIVRNRHSRLKDVLKLDNNSLIQTKDERSQ